MEQIKLTGKINDVDLKGLQPKHFQLIMALVKEIDLKQQIIDKKQKDIDKKKAIILSFKPFRKIIYKMCLQCNFLQHSWNERISENAKAILDEVTILKEQLGERPLKLPDLTPKE